MGMLILKKPSVAEFMVKNSRFIAEAVPVDSPESAKAFWHAQKERYDNGGHIVYAFITGPQGNIMGCSDDGEPSGTAGRPMLAVLKGSGLTNVIITAARWFGGTKLGTGGLVRAYSDCARLALENAEVCELVPMEEFSMTIPYNLYDQVKYLFLQYGFTVKSEDFAANITITGEIKAADFPVFKNALQELTRQ
ncbi:MAG: YigZ family protein [Lentisphaeria bacterium]|nr:YigZ family protein [Lentisphaeria bacterium]